MSDTQSPSKQPPQRVQTGVRLHRPLVQVLKALAEHRGMSLGDLIEGIVLHGLENRPAFSHETLAAIARLREVYGLDWTAADSHLHPE